ncbi:glycosyltransferase [Gluconacetobacter takamatsuzukensis]|uniref:Glycosyltransferase n=1 Tax=Gluconacetobacter takamatsuzukensis TaxID=1286190 RepID=A0A7W4KCC4_9PROT|nr:glycosyltransferase [Gluconacetobacter takamatsuzukensis]MBB2204260.1 glycosyltransferase [Gluconacetobacter takamatsuzukensis]
MDILPPSPDVHSSWPSSRPEAAPSWQAAPNPARRAPRVAILLSTFNGAPWLPAQLDSILAQDWMQWIILWRDDGSTDGSPAIMHAFQSGPGAGRCREIDPGGRHLGITASYQRLLRAAPPASTIAFAEQDDVWLPDKLARGLASLADTGTDGPALYCSRQILVDSSLRPLGLSPAQAERPSLLAALTQNTANGCTVMMNDAARALAASRTPPAAPVAHDWWACLLVLAAGGTVRVDPHPTILHRRHPGTVEATLRGLHRGPDRFMRTFQQNVRQLLALDGVLSATARSDLARIDAALNGRRRDRLRLLRTMSGLQRHRPAENLLFRLRFVAG